jgi:hypothetical protein
MVGLNIRSNIKLGTKPKLMTSASESNSFQYWIEYSFFELQNHRKNHILSLLICI